jgi:hypothetical protein
MQTESETVRLTAPCERDLLLRLVVAAEGIHAALGRAYPSTQAPEPPLPHPVQSKLDRISHVCTILHPVEDGSGVQVCGECGKRIGHEMPLAEPAPSPSVAASSMGAELAEALREAERVYGKDSGQAMAAEERAVVAVLGDPLGWRVLGLLSEARDKDVATAVKRRAVEMIGEEGFAKAKAALGVTGREVPTGATLRKLATEWLSKAAS